MTTIPDPRPFYAAATEWTSEILAGVRPDQLADPTPCEEFDVATLSAHLIGVARRVVQLATVHTVDGVDAIAETHEATAYAATVDEAVDLWSDDALLTTTVAAPWGRVPGAGALWGYVNETLVHGWDLAVATAQLAEADPAIVVPTLAAARDFLPATMRGGPVPFAAVVTPRPDAGSTEQLANWNGRDAGAWIDALRAKAI